MAKLRVKVGFQFRLRDECHQDDCGDECSGFCRFLVDDFDSLGNILEQAREETKEMLSMRFGRNACFVAINQHMTNIVVVPDKPIVKVLVIGQSNSIRHYLCDILLPLEITEAWNVSEIPEHNDFVQYDIVIIGSSNEIGYSRRIVSFVRRTMRRKRPMFNGLLIANTGNESCDKELAWAGCEYSTLDMLCDLVDERIEIIDRARKHEAEKRNLKAKK